MKGGMGGVLGWVNLTPAEKKFSQEEILGNSQK